MAHDKSGGILNSGQESEEIESIVEIIEKELASVRTDPKLGKTSDEMELLVSDLLGYLSVDSKED